MYDKDVSETSINSSNAKKLSGVTKNRRATYGGLAPSTDRARGV